MRRLRQGLVFGLVGPLQVLASFGGSASYTYIRPSVTSGLVSRHGESLLAAFLKARTPLNPPEDQRQPSKEL